MQFDTIAAAVRSVPHTSPEDGRILYEFVLNSGCEDILELGFAHGTSTCYLAGALEERGRGHITSIDNVTAKDRVPNYPQQLEKLGLSQWATPVYAHSSYTWELMKLIEQNTHDGVCTPVFDFCFLDGAHQWEPDGFAFFLVDKLLRPGGWILFDDVPWTIGGSPAADMKELAATLSPEERDIPHVERIFTLLVAQHPSYENLEVRDLWGWAQKKGGTAEQSAVAATVSSAYAQRTLVEDGRALLRRARRDLRARAHRG